MASFLLLTQYFPPEIGAAPVRLAQLAATLRNHGHSVTVVTALPNYPAGRVLPGYRKKLFVRETLNGQPVIRTWVYARGQTGTLARLATYGSFVVSSILGCLRAPRPDLLIVESPPIFLGLTAWFIHALTGRPYIVNVSDPWLEFAREMGFIRSQKLYAMFEYLERFVYRHALRVNAVTQAIRSLLIQQKHVPEDKVLWLPNGVDLESFVPSEPDVHLRNELGLSDRPTFVYAGSHQVSHGLEVVLEAAALLDSSIQLVFVGDGTDKQRLVSHARQRGLTNVRFLDPRPVSEIPRILSLGRGALVVLRGEEAFSGSRPAKMLPAMACGIPLVYCGRGEGARIVSESDSGLVVPPGDARALAQALRVLATDAALARHLGRNGRRYVERGSSWHSVVGEWLASLDGVVTPASTMPAISDAQRSDVFSASAR